MGKGIEGDLAQAEVDTELAGAVAKHPSSDLIDACLQIGSLAESNAPFTAGLTEWLNENGKPIDAYTIGELRGLIGTYSEAFNKGYERVGGFPSYADLKAALAAKTPSAQKHPSSAYTFRQFYIPERMVPGLRRYIEEGVMPGAFLSAVLRNDFRAAAFHADDENAVNLPAYAGYLYNEAPADCYGSPEKVAAWAASKSRASA